VPLTRGQLANLCVNFLLAYFDWAQSQRGSGGVIPYIPQEYNHMIRVFVEKYVRIVKMVRLANESWTIVLSYQNLSAPSDEMDSE
jgi:hypothetical protein